MQTLSRLALVALFATLSTACTTQRETPVTNTYGTLSDGTTANLYTLTNANGLTATVTDFGATLVSVSTPDRDGNLADITIGYDTLDGWVNDGSYMGATVGRYGNRIANGKFTLNDTEYTLATNNDPNHLHGGTVGFNKKMWSAQRIHPIDGDGVQFTYVSPDGEEGYPGQLTSVVTYTLNNSDELVINFEATTTAPTVVNIVHHTYWNLTGDPAQKILDHKLMLLADGYTPIDETSIPNNGIQPVEDTPFDFRSATAIGKRIDDNNEQLKN
ncbi:MAG: aldose epimerase family protein, partial [Phycisphaeraceae bacterium]